MLPGRSMLWLQIAIVFVGTQMAYLDLLPANLLHWPMADKVLHLLLFGAVAFWLNLYLQGRSVRLWRIPVPLAILIPLALAALEEMLQSFSSVRTASAADLASDLAGMILFWWASRILVAPGPKSSGLPESASLPSPRDL